jgi:hypothetical protein
MGRFGLNSLGSVQYMVQWRSFMDAVMKSSKKPRGGGGEWRIFLDHLNGYPLVKKNSAPWN